MEHDRFDDVEFRIVEMPEPAPRRRRRGRVALATLIVAAGLGAGASALASSDEPGSAAGAQGTKSKASETFDGNRAFGRDRDRDCKRGGKRDHGRRSAPDTALRY